MDNDFVKKVIDDRLKNVEVYKDECNENIKFYKDMSTSNNEALVSYCEGLKQGYEMAIILLKGIKDLL